MAAARSRLMPQLQETRVNIKAEQDKFKVAGDSARQAMKDIVSYVKEMDESQKNHKTMYNRAF